MCAKQLNILLNTKKQNKANYTLILRMKYMRNIHTKLPYKYFPSDYEAKTNNIR